MPTLMEGILAQFTTVFDDDPNSPFIKDAPFPLAQNMQYLQTDRLLILKFTSLVKVQIFKERGKLKTRSRRDDLT